MPNQSDLLMLRDKLRAFAEARDWDQFHSPKNLSMALMVEVAELMEHFQWLTIDESRNITNAEKLSQIGEEIADVLCYTLAIANELNLDLSSAMLDKMVKNIAKYPAEKFHGRYE